MALPATLEKDFARMGLDDSDLAPEVTPDLMEDRRRLVRVESAHILSQQYLERDRVKERIEREDREKLRQATRRRERSLQRWEKKTARSPFLVDLLAEDERIYEENEMRRKEEAKKTREVERRMARAKNAIILKALAESSDLEALRREKRAIMEEERRLRAMLALEKSVAGHSKKAHIAAQRAERERRAARAAVRKQMYRDALEEYMAEEAEVLKRKGAVPTPPDNTFSSHSGYREDEPQPDPEY